MLDFSTLGMTSDNPTLIAIVYALSLTFVLGSMLAILYVKTFRGLSFSKNFVHSLVLAPIVVTIIMQSIGNNLAVGIGMAGAISMLRFRSNLKDPRDMFFLFASMAVGVACGVQSYTIGVAGGIGFAIVITILHFSPMAQVTRFDGLLRLNLDNEKAVQDQLQELVTKNCIDASLVSLRELAQGNRLEYAYQIKLKPQVRHDSFVREIKELSDARGVNLMLQNATSEV